jgi:hypothetical protein
MEGIICIAWNGTLLLSGSSRIQDSKHTADLQENGLKWANKEMK